MTILWEFDEKHLSNLPNRVTKSVPQRQKPSSAQAIYGTAEPVPFVGHLLGPVKASGAAKIGHLKNLIWTSLAELSPGLQSHKRQPVLGVFFNLPQNRHPERSA